MQYDKNKNINLLAAPIPIKYLPDVTNVLCSLTDTIMKEGNFSDAWNVFACHCANGSYQIQGVDFDKYYSPVEHTDSFRINISIVDIHRITASILDVSNTFHNTNVTIHEKVCVITPPYYMDRFKKP